MQYRRYRVLAMIAAFGTAACGARFQASEEGSDGGADGGSSNASGGRVGGGKGGSSSGGAGGTGAGGRRGSGGTASTGGAGSGSGGVVGAGGAACGPCPGVACGPPVTLQITASSPSGAGVVNLSAEGDGIDFECYAGGLSCRWTCHSTQYQLADGSYTVRVSAPGYETAVLSIDVRNPTNCGCCGCCPFYTHETLSLKPDGGTSPSCCADLVNDPMNCGVCGKRCDAGVACQSGKCANETCDEIEKTLTEFVEQNRECTTEADCTSAWAGCAPIRDFCDGTVYLAKNYDAAAFAALLDEWESCNGELDCAICDAIAPPPACVDGRCG